MQNAISIFNFNQSQVRIQFHNGEPYFCLKDIAAILEIKNTKQSRFNLNEKGVHKMYHQTTGGNQEITFINEPNLYRVIFRSNKPEAVKFQDWIFEEVIPKSAKQAHIQAAPKPQPMTAPHFAKLYPHWWAKSTLIIPMPTRSFINALAWRTLMN